MSRPLPVSSQENRILGIVWDCGRRKLYPVYLPKDVIVALACAKV